jgi:hypothetical protein
MISFVVVRYAATAGRIRQSRNNTLIPSHEHEDRRYSSQLLWV